MKFVIKDDRIKDLKVSDTAAVDKGEIPFLKSIAEWCNEHYQARADDKNYRIELDKAILVGSFFPHDMVAESEEWNKQLGSYCERMYDYLNTDIKSAEEFWWSQEQYSSKKQELLRLAKLVAGVWDDTAKFIKLGFGSDAAQLSEEEVDDIRKNPQRYAFVEGMISMK